MISAYSTFNSFELQILDVSQVPTFDHANLVIEKLAHLHGAWWQLLNDKTMRVSHPDSENPITMEDIMDFWVNRDKSVLAVLKTSFAMIVKLLENNEESEELIEKVNVNTIPFVRN